jgi:hypothetical protein
MKNKARVRRNEHKKMAKNLRNPADPDSGGFDVTNRLLRIALDGRLLNRVPGRARRAEAAADELLRLLNALHQPLGLPLLRIHLNLQLIGRQLDFLLDILQLLNELTYQAGAAVGARSLQCDPRLLLLLQFPQAHLLLKLLVCHVQVGRLLSLQRYRSFFVLVSAGLAKPEFDAYKDRMRILRPNYSESGPYWFKSGRLPVTR